jgi:hypothetical protein
VSLVAVIDLVLQLTLYYPRARRHTLLLSVHHTCRKFGVEQAFLLEFCRRHQMEAFPCLEFERDVKRDGASGKIVFDRAQLTQERLREYREGIGTVHFRHTMNDWFRANVEK